MNGLCEQCQLYYPMPPDFAEGVPYACPECGGGLVPWSEAPDDVPDGSPEEGLDEALDEAAFDAEARADAPDLDVDVDLDAPDPQVEAEGETGDSAESREAEAWEDLVPESLPPPSDRTIPTIRFSGGPERSDEVAAATPPAAEEADADEAPPAPEPPAPEAPTPEAPAPEAPAPEAPAPEAPAPEAVPADRARDDILAALSEMADAPAPETPVQSAPTEAAAPDDAAAVPDAPTRFVHRGAGEGVARESLPPLPHAEAPASEPEREPAPPVRAAPLATASARRGPPPRRGLGWTLTALLLVGLLGAAGAAWWFGVPWLGLEPAGPGAAAMADAAKAARTSPKEAPVAPAQAPPADAEAVPAEAGDPDPDPAGPAALPATDGAPASTAGSAASGAPADAPADAPAAAPGPTTGARATPAVAPTAPTDASRRERAVRRVRDGNALLKEGRVDPAIQAFEQALLLDGRNGFAHRGLGIAYARLGRAAEAAREYELYLQLVPDAAEADEVRRIVDAYYATRRP